MPRRKIWIERAAFTRKLRVWGGCGCVLGLVAYALVYRYDASSANRMLVSSVLSEVIFALAGLIFGRVLVTFFYDTDSAQ
jgi:hypothetical protein